MALRNYTRWREEDGRLAADLLGMSVDIWTSSEKGMVFLEMEAGGKALTPDEARLIGVRLIEAAALADGPRAIRRSA